jgi:hypothetical protein
MIEAKPENLIGDRAYDSGLLDEELGNDGIEIAVKPATQDRRWLLRYTRSWLLLSASSLKSALFGGL